VEPTSADARSRMAPRDEDQAAEPLAERRAVDQFQEVHWVMRWRRLLAHGLAFLLSAVCAAGAHAAIARDCRDVALPSAPALPVDALPFQALTAAHVQAIPVASAPIARAVLQTAFDQGGRFNEAEGGAVVAVITKQGRPAKLVVKVTGTELIVREFTTFPGAGESVVSGKDVRLVGGRGIDLDRGRVTTTAGETDLRWVTSSSGPTLGPANGARLAVLVPRIAIPVTAHFMTRRGSTFDPQTFVSLTRLQELFTADGPLNVIWGRAGLLFVVARVEACTHAVDDFLPERPVEREGVPAPSGDCRSLFRRINAVHDSPLAMATPGAADAEPAFGADLYLWMAVGWNQSDKLFGYGAQHRADGPNPGLGAVWMSAVSCLTAGAGCGPRLAHELGHFLGLCHVCLTEAVTPPSERGWCGFCTNVPVCTAGQSNLLMRDDAAGERLTPDEVMRARQKAAAHRWRGGAP
jgi:hypothetical protein